VKPFQNEIVTGGPVYCPDSYGPVAGAIAVLPHPATPRPATPAATSN
jgi:hypothetical protein